MDKATNHSQIHDYSVAVATNTFINSYLREIHPGEKYFRKPNYDPVVAAYFEERSHERWIKIPLKHQQTDVFCALDYYSELGRHTFTLPVMGRDIATDAVRDLTFEELVFITLKEFELAQMAASDKQNAPAIAVANVVERLKNHLENLEAFLAWHAERPEKLAQLFAEEVSFIEAEQALVLGHATHPLAKSREGFTADELLAYSPETGEKFALNYYLASPQIVWQGSTSKTPVGQQLREELLQDDYVVEEVKEQINAQPDWPVLPIHPWEAHYLSQQPIVQELLSEGLLIDLGITGKTFSATSSIRTVYNEQSDYMYKLSLHVKVTNSERVNIAKELHRSLDIGRLFESELGQRIRSAYPTFEPITDPAYIGIKYKGEHIDGFNTSFRNNPFKTRQNVSLLAAICQDSVLGHPARLETLMASICEKEGCSTQAAAEEWFKRYLKVGFRNLVRIYNEFGLVFEAHQQNTLVRIDDTGYPDHFYFRDNQGFFFWDEKKEAIQKELPGLGEVSESYGPKEFINSKYSYYLIINNILGVVDALGRNQLAPEKDLIQLFYEEVQFLQPEDQTGFMEFLLNSRCWEVKGNLLTRLYDMDEVLQPIDNQSVYLHYLNPLHQVHYQKNIVNPGSKDIVFKRYFAKDELTMTLRSFDFEKGDLELMHQWFHLDYAKPYWAMNLSIRELEAFYMNLLASDHAHSFIGEINGEIKFTVETYWASRDLLGEYYDALPTDYGLHFMMGPRDKSTKHHTLYAARTGVEFVLAHPEVKRFTGEPKSDARPMQQVMYALGFKFHANIQLPHKEASLFFLSREDLQEKFPDNDGYKELYQETLLATQE